MDEYPSNTHGENPSSKREVIPSGEIKRATQVTVNQVSKRKKPLGKRFVESFAGGDDARTVFGYVVLEVIVPATKDAIADAVSQGIERMLFGEARSTSRRTGTRPGYTNYSRYSQTTRPAEPREISRVARARHDFEEVVISTRAEADQVLSSMLEVLEKYNVISVADFYDLVGITGTHTDNKWGWEDLRGVGIVRVRDGYLLDLPKPDALR